MCYRWATSFRLRSKLRRFFLGRNERNLGDYCQTRNDLLTLWSQASTALSVAGLDRSDLVWSKYSCGAFVVLEQAAESVMTFSRGTQWMLFVAQIWKEQSVAFPL